MFLIIEIRWTVEETTGESVVAEDGRISLRGEDRDVQTTGGRDIQTESGSGGAGGEQEAGGTFQQCGSQVETSSQGH